MKSEDVKTARNIFNRVNEFEGPEGFLLWKLLFDEPTDSRRILEKAKERFGMTSWIEAGLNCRKDEDVAAEALADFFTDLEPEVIHAGKPG